MPNSNADLINLDLIQPLHWREPRYDALRAAAEFDRPQAIAKLLLDDSRWAKASDPKRRLTALMVAAANGYVECVRLLMPASDPAMANADGETALMMSATHEDHEDSFRLIILPKSNLAAKSAKGWTALGYAARSNHENCAKAYLQAAARDRDLSAKALADIAHEASIIAAKSGHHGLASWLPGFAEAIREKEELAEAAPNAAATTSAPGLRL